MAASYWLRDMLLRLLQELVHHDPSATKELELEEITFQRAFGLPHAGEREQRSDPPRASPGCYSWRVPRV